MISLTIPHMWHGALAIRHGDTIWWDGALWAVEDVGINEDRQIEVSATHIYHEYWQVIVLDPNEVVASLIDTPSQFEDRKAA